MIKMQYLLNQEDAKVYPFKNQPLATGKQLRLFVFDTGVCGHVHCDG